MFDGFAPLIATWLVSVTGNPLAPAFYAMTGGAISAIAVLTMKERLKRRSSEPVRAQRVLRDGILCSGGPW